MAAARLAAGGIKTILIDEKLAWEKPCGGGLTYKAYSQYPFLRDNDTPKKTVTESWLHAPGAGGTRLDLNQPVLIYSRLDLNKLLLRRAEKAGAEIEKTRVLELVRRDGGWRVRTGAGVIEADYCIAATGARNNLRNVGTEYHAADSMTALGYLVPSDRSRIDVQFLAGLEGYIWVFPRRGHLSVGICGKGEPASALRQRLEQYMREHGIPLRDASFHGHMLPSLERQARRTNRIAGDGWMAVGDAAGLVDPITGEGLYYAIRPGDLAAGRILAGHGGAESATLAKRLCLGRFLFGTVTARMVQRTRSSRHVHDAMQELFGGTLPHLSLKRKPMGGAPPPFVERPASPFPRRMIA